MSSDKPTPTNIETDVFIAGSGPIGCAFVRELLDKTAEIGMDTKIWMAEIGAQNDPVIGAHHKNAIKYQKDIDSFVYTIQGALQRVSVPPASAHIPTLNTISVTHIPEPKASIACTWEHSDPSIQRWPPPPQPCTWPQWPRGKPEVSSFFNPCQVPEHNLPGCAITRTVGGMATHWTCACPRPDPEEYKNSPIKDKLPDLLERAEKLLNVRPDQFDNSTRHKLVKSILENHPTFKGRVRNLPLAVERVQKDRVIWSGSNTVLGKWAYPENCCTDPECKGEKNKCKFRFSLHPEHKVVKLNREQNSEGQLEAVESALVHNLRTGERLAVRAKIFIIACGAICTPQILWNSGFGDRGGNSTKPDAPELRALGRYLTEQSLSFCQIVLKREYIEGLLHSPNDRGQHPLAPLGLSNKELEAIGKNGRDHLAQFENDSLPIPFTDPEPQVNIKFTKEKPWHAQIHRDAFSYGDVGPRADPRTIVDLRFFGHQEVSACNRVKFEDGYTDIYGLPQPTFEVYRSEEDVKRDHDMMLEMCEAAHALGAFLPGSYPQFMQPGLALHITGTTRIGKDGSDSVANEFSQVHRHSNLYVGGNNVIPDSTACNPTLTSTAYALHATSDIIGKLKEWSH